MTPQMIERILTQEFNAERDGEQFTIDESHKCVLLVEHAGGVMQVARVLSLRFDDDIVVARTEEETYFLLVDSIFGLKGSAPDQKSARPGFRRA